MTNIEFPKKVSDTPKSAASETKPMEMILFLFKFLTPFNTFLFQNMDVWIKSARYFNHII